MQRNDWDLPPPPEVAPVTGGSPWRIVVALAVAGALAVGAFVVPIPIFFLYVPGPVRDVGRLVAVADVKTYSSEGQLFLTTVSIDTSVTLVDVINAAIDPSIDVVLEEEVTQGQSLEDVRRQAEIDMKLSKQAARQTALAALGIPAGDGARILDTVETAPAFGVFEEGDRVVAVDGERVTSTCDVIAAISEHRPKDVIRITFVRGEARRKVSITAAEHPAQEGAAFVGIEMEDALGESIGVRFKTGEIAGPSAGLMFALALYDRLTPDDLTDGRKIAGTGTIACGGAVGAIGGIEEKVAGAERQGAEIFLAPELNFEAAQSAADDIEVVAVGTFSDAVEYLEGL